jgi:hypothetical protein
MIIVVMVGLVVGANILAPLNTAVNVSNINVSIGYSAAVVSTSGLLPLMATVVLMIFAVRAIGD